MVLFITITFICIFFILIDLVPIYQKKQWLLLWVYSAMILFVYLINILIAAGIRIPSPAAPLKKIVTAIWG